MTWTTPPTLAVGDPGTSAYLNAYVRDNTNFLASTTGAWIDTNEATTSTTFVDLATPGPSVTLITGTKAIVMLSVWGNTAGGGYGLMSYAVSGATTFAASDDRAAAFTPGTVVSAAAIRLLTGLIPGVNIFTAKYRSTGPSQQFENRSITVIPLP